MKLLLFIFISLHGLISNAAPMIDRAYHLGLPLTHVDMSPELYRFITSLSGYQDLRNRTSTEKIYYYQPKISLDKNFGLTAVTNFTTVDLHDALERANLRILDADLDLLREWNRRMHTYREMNKNAYEDSLLTIEKSIAKQIEKKHALEKRRWQKSATAVLHDAGIPINENASEEEVLKAIRAFRLQPVAYLTFVLKKGFSPEEDVLFRGYVNELQRRNANTRVYELSDALDFTIDWELTTHEDNAIAYSMFAEGSTSMPHNGTVTLPLTYAGYEALRNKAKRGDTFFIPLTLSQNITTEIPFDGSVTCELTSHMVDVLRSQVDKYSNGQIFSSLSSDHNAHVDDQLCKLNTSQEFDPRFLTVLNWAEGQFMGEFAHERTLGEDHKIALLEQFHDRHSRILQEPLVYEDVLREFELTRQECFTIHHTSCFAIFGFCVADYREWDTIECRDRVERVSRWVQKPVSTFFTDELTLEKNMNLHREFTFIGRQELNTPLTIHPKLCVKLHLDGAYNIFGTASCE